MPVVISRQNKQLVGLKLPCLSVHARPFDYKFDRDRIALIVIDMQRDFLESDGFGASVGCDVTRLRSIIPSVVRLIDLFRRHHLPIIHTRECHRPDLSDCHTSKRMRGNPSLRIGDTGPMGRILIDGELGNQLIPECASIDGEAVITKPGKGMFYATQIQQLLQSINAHYLVFAGVTTDVCVQTSMREANDRGYDCLLIEDATESYYDGFRQAVVDSIVAQNAVVGWSTTIDLFESVFE